MNPQKYEHIFVVFFQELCIIFLERQIIRNFYKSRQKILITKEQSIMKKKITMLLLTALMVGLVACGNEAEPNPIETPESTAETINQEAEDAAKAEAEAAAKAEEEAAKAAEEAARQEEANSYYELGRAYLYALDGQEIDLESAYTNFEKALELGKTEANFYLGVLCDSYNYPVKDYEKARAYYEAAGDNLPAHLSLGFLYYNGNGVEENKEKAQELFDAVVAEGYVEGYLGSATIAKDSEDYETALEYYNKVLEGEEQLYIANAMYYIGTLYDNGRGVELDDTVAMEWYEKAANLGNTSAMNSAGYGYGSAEGVEEDLVKAFELYLKAADLGNASAMYNVGRSYMAGQGVELDYAKAMEWFEKSADAGNFAGMYGIGYLYSKGWGVEQDDAKAQEWFDKYEAARP